MQALRATLLALALLLPGCLGGDGPDAAAPAAPDPLAPWRAVQMDLAWEAGLDGRGVRVAVVDSGIDRQHPAFAPLFDGAAANGEVVAYRDFVYGANGTEAAEDAWGHGSGVASLLSRSPGPDGARGGAPAVQLIVARFCLGFPCDEDAAPALAWAREQGAQVIVLPWGQADCGACVAQEAMRAQIEAAHAAGIVVLASMGNEGSFAPAFPASMPEVFAVGAEDGAGRVAPFSNRGVANSGRPLVVAPGLEVPVLGSTTAGHPDAARNGTSFAVAVAAAGVALLLQDRPVASPDDVEALRDALADTADRLTGQDRPHDPAAGFGLLQVWDAVQARR